MALHDDNTGAGAKICAQDSLLVSPGEPCEYEFDPRYEPKQPNVYINLYNNHRRTNFARSIANGGRMTSRVRLWAFDKFPRNW